MPKASLDRIADLIRDLHKKRHDESSPFPDYLKIVNARDDVLSRFQSIFADAGSLTKDAFQEFLAFKNNQHWTGLQRSTSRSTDDMPRLRSALHHLFDEGVSISSRIDALTDGGDFDVPGLSYGILTPCLLVRYPDKYAVWNGKSEAASKVLKIWPHFKRGASLGERYKILNDLFLQLAERTALDLWCLDGIWHVVNEKSRKDANDALLEAARCGASSCR